MSGGTGEGEQDSQEQISEAKGIGWVPKEEFRGDPKNWVDAQTYLERGRTVLPILKATNKRLQADLDQTRVQITELRQKLDESTDAIGALKEHNSQFTRQQARETRKGLLDSIKESREAGDVDTEMQLQRKLDDVDEVLEESENKETSKGKKKAAGNEEATKETKISPALQQWVKDNAWFEDPEQRAVAIAYGEKLRRDPDTKDISHEEFLEKVKVRVKQLFPEGERKGSSDRTLPGGRSSGGGGGGGRSRAKGFDDLPNDAKEACDRQSLRLVGPNRAFKTKEDWRTKYAQDYFREAQDNG